MIGRWVALELSLRTQEKGREAAINELYRDLKSKGPAMFRGGIDRSGEAIKYMETYYKKEITIGRNES